MVKNRQSRHEKLLRELGFRPIEELHSKENVAEVDTQVEKAFGRPMPHRLSRSDRRKLIAEGVLPSFAQIEGDTQAFDERGREWWAVGQIVDLQPFGFSDNVQYFKDKAAARKKVLN